MKTIIQILLLFFIQLNIFGYCFSQSKDTINTLHINVKNLNQENLDTAQVTVIQLNSNKEQTVRYFKDNRCFIATSLELGKVLIRVEMKGYDTQEIHHVIGDTRESALIIMGKTNSLYYLINSNKYPFETNGETVCIYAGKDHNTNEFFKGRITGDNVLVLNSGWYKFESLSTTSGTVYLLTPSEKQKQGPLLADLRKLYPDKPIGLLINIVGDVNILLNSCAIQFYSDVNENEIGNILQNAGAIKWEIIRNTSFYRVTFRENSGLELLKIADTLRLMKEIRYISSDIYSTNIPETLND